MGLTKLPTSNNEWADFWRYQIGVNVIPADTKNKTTWVKWSQYQNKPITGEQHKQWKLDDDFSKGMALIPGKVWHSPSKNGLYLIFIDLDNEKAIEEFCTRNGTKVPLQDLANYMIIEQHSIYINQIERMYIVIQIIRSERKAATRAGAYQIR